MSGRKVLLLLLILGFGASVETAWRIRELGVGASGCRVMGLRFSGPSFAFTDDERREPAASSVEITNAFGGVDVALGDPGAVSVTLRKVVFLPSEARARTFAESIKLQTSLEGGVLKLGANRRELESSESREVGFETHLEVRVPPGTALKVANEHGAVALADTASAEVDSSYDSVKLERVAGDARISHRHGSVSVSGVKGSLKLDTRYGDVELREVASADVHLEHGDLSLRQGQALRLELRHGDLEAEGVRGDLEVLGAHARIRAAEVTGHAKVETAFRDVSLSRVAGGAWVSVEHGAVSLEDVTGAVEVEASYESVSLRRIAGPVSVRVAHGGVRAEALEQGAQISASGDDVVLDGFKGAVVLEVERGGVQLVPAAALVDSLSVTTRHGDIRLEVPRGSRCELEALAAHGDIEVDPDLTLQQPAPGRVAGLVGGGGPRVRLEARGGNVYLASRATLAKQE